MIQVTRLNGESFVLNALYIEKVQNLPDTTITLVSGKKYFVKEEKKEIVDKTIQFYKSIGLAGLQGNVEESYE
ncbi:flagellar protein FlbD [Salinibacillus kushneri]|uniref:Flagellar protein FlbD n=1 Tax=Salinibacillus kushneri TaxID=237682 RepID=A0A1I0E8W1_9BACI|nr:flagellar FlbD family protein [Salinibacillus kushneri]SET41600.1 flagellar protein FlbD [Salinibacillus kushneri]